MHRWFSWALGAVLAAISLAAWLAMGQAGPRTVHSGPGGWQPRPPATAPQACVAAAVFSSNGSNLASGARRSAADAWPANATVDGSALSVGLIRPHDPPHLHTFSLLI